MSRFVGSPEDRFFHDEAHFYVRHSSPICILLSCSIPVVGWYFFYQSRTQCRSRSVGFIRSQLILNYNVFKKKIMPCSEGQGLIISENNEMDCTIGKYYHATTSLAKA